MTGLFGAFMFEIGLITYRGVTQGATKVPNSAPLHAPLPSNYTSAIFVYSALALLPKALAPIPALVGWGFVVATFLNIYTPGSANAGNASNVSLTQGLTQPAQLPTPTRGVAAPKG